MLNMKQNPYFKPIIDRTVKREKDRWAGKIKKSLTTTLSSAIRKIKSQELIQ